MPHGTATEDPPQIGLTQQLAAFVVKTTWDDIQPIRNVIECGLLDYIGLASYTAEHVDSSPAFIEAINNLSADGPGSVLGLSRRYQVQYSALLNGTLLHSMDWDDTNSVASLHPGASAISAAFAQAELEMHGRKKRQVTGREFLTAIAVGYEVTCRIGRSASDVLHNNGLHPTSVVGVFGAAATAGKLAGFNAEQIANLWGVVGSMASGSLQCFESGTWNKRFHPGIAAHNALLGVQYTKAGMLGATKALEGVRGFLFAYARLAKPDPEIVKDLGIYWETSNTAIKPYPCCRLVHGPIEAAYELRKQFSDPASVPQDTAMDVTVGFKAYRGMGIGPNKVRPRNLVEGQFSLPFQFAVAWLYGRNDWETYQRLDDPKVLEICQRLKVHLDDTVREGSLKTSASIGGKTVTIDFPLGEPENPIGLPQVENKVGPMLEKVFGSDGATRIVKQFHNLSDLDDLSVFIANLRT